MRIIETKLFYCLPKTFKLKNVSFDQTEDF